MVIRAFEFSDRTLAAMGKLADLTTGGGRDRVAKLVQDALRVYEWVIFQQVHGRTVVALEQSEMDALRKSERVTSEREALQSFVPASAIREAQEYFDVSPARTG